MPQNTSAEQNTGGLHLGRKTRETGLQTDRKKMLFASGRTVYKENPKESTIN